MSMKEFEVPQFKVDRSAKPEKLVEVDSVWITEKEASMSREESYRAFLEKLPRHED